MKVGLISQIPYALSHYNSLWSLDFNVIITLFATFLMLVSAESISNHLVNRLVVFALIMVTFCCDWEVIGPFMAWLFYQNHNDRKAQIKYYSFICAIQVISAAVFLAKNGSHWYGELWQAGMFLVIPVLLCYNGEAGSKSPINKWIFYIIYPLHLLVIFKSTRKNKGRFFRRGETPPSFPICLDRAGKGRYNGYVVT